MSDISKQLATFAMLGGIYMDMLKRDKEIKHIKSYNAEEIRKAKEKGHEAIQKLKEKLNI